MACNGNPLDGTCLFGGGQTCSVSPLGTCVFSSALTAQQQESAAKKLAEIKKTPPDSTKRAD